MAHYIHAFDDTPHLLKSIRNNLFTNGLIKLYYYDYQ